MKNQSKLILAFVAGAAAGAAVAYLVVSEKGEDIITEIRNLAGKIRDNVSERMAKSKQGNSGTGKNEGEEFMGV